MKEGDRYIIEWWYGYANPEVMKEECVITSCTDDKNFSFSFTNKWGTLNFNTGNCRSVKLIQKLN